MTASSIHEQSPATDMTFGFDLTLGTDEFVADDSGKFEERTLGLGQASGGLVRARHIRARGNAEAGARQFVSDGHQVMYIVRGSVVVSGQDGESHRLESGAAAYFPPELSYLLHEQSFDFEALFLTASDISGLGQEKAKAAVYDHEADGSYKIGGPGREYLSFRHLRLADRTDRQFEVTLIKGVKSPAGGTGWHRHSNSEWVFVLGGAAEMAMEGHRNFTIRAGDSLTIPPGVVHAVPEFSDDYALVAVNLPADFKTEAAEAPRV
ncbi:MAG: cupin domain-containing protein [Hyphomicrobiales bacterium]|nr:cupin domain-containing protein [Hyphomicrobiales bacterium]